MAGSRTPRLGRELTDAPARQGIGAGAIVQLPSAGRSKLTATRGDAR
jgi:hypothetical protein